MEVVIDHISDDSDLESKLVLPAAERMLHSRIEETSPAVRNKSNEKEQVTLTNQWLNTKKHGRDDEEIERGKKDIS